MTTATLAMADEAAPDTDADRLQALYESHAEAVYLTALRVTGNPADAEDVLQTVFLRVFDAGIALDGARSPGAYLRRSAVNAGIDVLRRKRSRRETAIQRVGAAPGEPDRVDGGTLTRSGVEHDERILMKQRLRAALAGISPDSAELFVLCYLEGYSYDELAEMLRIERGTVANRLHRIRATLKKELSR